MSYSIPSNVSVSFISGLKQDHKGDYYIAHKIKDNGDIDYNSQFNLYLVEDTTEIEVNMRQDTKGHIWKITRNSRKTVDCTSPLCSICAKYHNRTVEVEALETI
jgi:hypothetical protein